MDAQDRVAAFFDRHDLEGRPAYQALDLASEVGEIAGDAAKSTTDGEHPEELSVKTDELGDALSVGGSAYDLAAAVRRLAFARRRAVLTAVAVSLA